MVEIRHLYTFGLQCLWAAFLLHLADQDRGLGFAEYMAWVRTELGGESSVLPIGQYLDARCRAVDLKQGWKADHPAFMQACLQETELDENEAGISKTIEGMVTYQDVSFGYNGAAVLQDISFTARPGRTIAIVGQTGSGKTTLTRLINRIFDVNRGRVLVDDVDVRDWNMESLRSQISTIEQDVFLCKTHTSFQGHIAASPG